MVETGDADAAITGLTKDYGTALKPALQIIGVDPSYNKVAGMYIIMNKKGVYFFADTTVQVNPTAEEMVDIIGMTAEAVEFFNQEPRIAILSYSNFGSVSGEIPEKTMKAVRLAKERYPHLIIDGDIQANVALNTELQKERYPFSELSDKGANTLIFPNLAAGNIAYKLVIELGSAHVIGPILLGLKKSFHILQICSESSTEFMLSSTDRIDGTVVGGMVSNCCCVAGIVSCCCCVTGIVSCCCSVILAKSAMEWWK